jgi:hypothetical protein
VGQHQARRSELAAVFGYPGVAGAYQYRPPYPAEVSDVLVRILTDRPRRVLAIVDHGHRDLPWRAKLTEIIVRHSRSPGYDPLFP